MDPVTIRPMSDDDVDSCSEVFDRAISQLRQDLALPSEAPSLGSAARRIAFLLCSSPGDSAVAELHGTIVGFAQATRRDDCWTLAHLFVDPIRQSSGIGTSLLNTVVALGTDLPVGLIGSTADPRAIRAYARLPGFRVHPTVRAEGRVTAPQVSFGGRSNVLADTADFDEAARIDRAVRGSARTDDLAHLLDEGHDFRSIPGRGYVVANDTAIATISALDGDAAGALLLDALSRTVGTEIELPRMTANQQWAIGVAVAAGLRLRPWGPLMVRGLADPPSPYLPHPALC